MKKIIFTVICLLALNTNVLALEINSKNAVVYNLNEDKVIYEKNSKEVISIASLTKIMTTIVAIEQIKDLDEKLTMKSRDFYRLYEEDASLAGFRVGQTVTYRDLLYGTFLPSGAEATQALAFNLTGSIENFVALMNEKAKEIGMNNSHFANTTGLDNKENYSTVEDVAKLLKYALKNKTFKEIYEANNYTTSDNSMTLYSSFRYTAKRYGYNVNSIIGAKTGYTDAAGKCLASTAYDKTNNILYMSVTCGANTSTDDAYHIRDNVYIYNYFFQNYKYQEILKKDELLVSIKTKYGQKEYAKFYNKEPFLYYLNNDFDINKVNINYDGIKEISNSIKRNDTIGKINIYYENELLGTKDIVLNDEYNFSIFKFLLETKILYGIIGFILLLILYKKFKHKKSLHR